MQQRSPRRATRRGALRTGVLLGAATGALPSAAWVLGRGWVLVGSLVAGATLLWAWLDAEGRALRSVHARRVGEPEQPRLHAAVADLCARSGQPMPRLWVSPLEAPNAFATGRSPRRAGLCVTAGLLAVLDERQLRAVLAHELAHVRARDTLAAGVIAAVSSALLAAAALAWLLPGGHDDEEGGSAGRLLALVVAPIAALALLLLLRRGREHAADAAAAAATGDPLALASALRTLEVGSRALPLAREPALRGTGALMVTDPFRGAGRLGGLLSTHPPLAERVARLEALAGWVR